MKTYPHIEQMIGHTPLVALRRLGDPKRNQLLVKLEGTNPAGSVKDRAALGIIQGAEDRGEIRPGDRLIEATSGNTGIALAMIAAIRGYRMTIIMPESLSQERRDAIRAYGAELILVSAEAGMLGARDMAKKMEQEGRGRVLDQFSNPDVIRAHYETTGPEIWEATQGTVTHFVSAMGTTGTAVGAGRFLRTKNPEVCVIGVQPAEGARIAGIRRWPPAYMPAIYDPSVIDRIEDVTQAEAEAMTRALAREEGISCGVSAGGAVAVMLRVAEEVENATLVAIIPDRGDRYLSTGLFAHE